MNLPSLVHHSQHQSHFSQPMLGHGHLHDQSILGSQQNHHYHHHHRHHSSSYPQHSNEYLTYPPAPPPSPPVEDNSKCSLPSISTLLVYADGGQTNGSGIDRPHNNQAPTQHYHGQQSQPQRMNLPPTPPMRPESGFEVNNSPTMSSQSPSSGYYYSQSSTHSHRNSYPPSTKPLYASSPTESHYSSQSTYYSPSQSGMVYNKHMSPHQSHQLLIPVTVAPPSTSNPWHHHHHSAPASHAPFPQSQDRYICQTCNKAFSRPSSLRIHSHSHTGEKPYKCPHHGCGKAFSVRSNMKRHERGCHQ